MIRLNLGCGNKILPGYVNIDYEDNYSGKRPDICCDLRKLELPSDHADEAMAIHVLEHFLPWEAEEVLREWARVLKPGGKMIVEVPCFDKVLLAFMEGKANASHWMALYGDWRYGDPRMLHRWCFTKAQLMELMGVVFEDVSWEPAQFHVPARDMRVTGIKNGTRQP